MVKRILPNASVKLVWWKQRKVSAIIPIFLAVSLHCKDKDTFLAAYRRVLHSMFQTVHMLYLSLQWLTHCLFFTISVELLPI